MLSPDLVPQYATDPMLFWSDLEIERADGTTAPFGESMAPFQRDFFQAVSPAILRVEGNNDVQVDKWWFYDQRHRGASKSSDTLAALIHPLIFSRRPLQASIVACDKDQAAIFIQLARRLFMLNPLVESAVELQAWKLRSERTGTEIQIVSSDHASFYGRLDDVLVADEVVLWPDDRLWTAAISTMAKRPHGVLFCLSNAGWTEDWSRRVYESMQQVPHCWFREMRGRAPWISDEHLETQRKLLPKASFDRLWNNRWVSGTGGGLDPGDIEDACVLSGPSYPEPECGYVCGLDLGIRRHHSSLAVLAVDWAAGRVKLAELLDWAPEDGADGKVSFEDVRQGIIDVKWRYRLNTIYYDRWQLEQMAGELTRDTGLAMEPVFAQGQIASEQATSLLTAFRDRRIAIYRHPLLLDDLYRAVIAERPTGYKVILAETENGHGDRLSAVLLALPTALQALANPPVIADDGLGGNLLDAVGGGV